MTDPVTITLAYYAAPLMVAAGFLMLLPASLPALERAQGFALALGALLIASLASLLLSVEGRPVTMDFSLLALAITGTAITAAPLLDRARASGLLIAAPIAGIAVIGGNINAGILSSAALVLTMLISAAITGLAGSTALAPSPARFTADGSMRLQPTAGGLSFAGWTVLALALMVIAHTLTTPAILLPIFISALTAALICVLATPHELVPTRAGQGLAAGAIIALLAPASPTCGAILGIVAGFCVLRSPAIGHSLRIDDPHQIIGAILLPAIAGLLLPGILTLELLAPQIILLGLSLAFGLGIAAILWPLTMLLLGLQRAGASNRSR